MVLLREVPFSKLDINETEFDRVREVLSSGWLTHGPYTEKFEKLFCDYTGAKYCTTVSNCTAGLHLSCLAAGFSDGDEVIVPAQTHTATAHAVELTGAKAVFVDVDYETANISITDIKNKLSDKTRGIIPVHMAGFPCQMDEIMAICDENNLILIEDCAHALGTLYQSKHVGNFGIAGNFSFYPTKQITTGEGGVIITNDKKIYDFVRTHKAFGIDTPPKMRHKPGLYDVRTLGLNYRLTDFQSALGLGQLERYDSNLKSRKENAKLYENLLSKSDKLEFLKYNDDSSYFIFQILLHDNISRDKLIFHLKKRNIGCSIHYATPVPLMTYYKRKYGYKLGDFPMAEKYGENVITLPIHSGLVKADIMYVCKTIIDFLEKTN
ncbi:MAG: hypothetical protein CL780_06890 [Chloroflexi bacterium]|nr:hypothetical protein [Chloroflexota bacterium]